MARGSRYHAPSEILTASLRELVTLGGRRSPSDPQLELLISRASPLERIVAKVFYAGDVSLLRLLCVSIVGTREMSEAGGLRATRLAGEVVAAGGVVVSGLAKGIDATALSSAMERGGRVIAVIGTPLDKAYPAENAQLQETIWRRHLLVSPFRQDEPVFRSNFPKRNRVMAALSDATVIVEASDTAGTLHQAAECQRLGRWLFVVRSVAEDQSLKWPTELLRKPKTAVLDQTSDIFDAIEQ